MRAIDIAVRVIPDRKQEPDRGRYPVKMTTYPAYKTIHRYVAGPGSEIITTRQPIPGLRQYVMHFSDGTFTGIGAEWDMLQPWNMESTTHG